MAPDGASTLISYGVLNLSRRQGFDRSEPMLPGQAETVRIASTIWASASQAGAQAAPRPLDELLADPLARARSRDLDASCRRMPAPNCRCARPDEGRARPAFQVSEAAANVPFTQLRRGRRERVIEEEATTGRTTVVINRDLGAYRLEADGLESMAAGSSGSA